MSYIVGMSGEIWNPQFIIRGILTNSIKVKIAKCLEENFVFYRDRR
jgi:hypothetical protein